ncbi:MAG: FliM/FliN family flagellar motor switch protein [Thermoguttaceae bacterium]
MDTQTVSFATGTPHAAAFPLCEFAPRHSAAPESAPIAAEQRDLRIHLGATRLAAVEARRLRSGTVIPLDRLAGEPIDLIVDGRRIARGELLVVDGKIAARVVELMGSE